MEEAAHLPDQYHPPYSLQRCQHMTSQHSCQQQMVWRWARKNDWNNSCYQCSSISMNFKLSFHTVMWQIFLRLTQVDVVGVEEEVRQVEELWDQLSDVPHVVPGGWLPLLLYIVKHPLRNVEASLCSDETQCCHIFSAQMCETLQPAY